MVTFTEESNLTRASLTKLLPLIVRSNDPEPLMLEVGLMLLMTGKGLVILRFFTLERPPPGSGLKTATLREHAFFSSDASIIVVSFVVETNLVFLSVLLTLINEFLIKLSPLTVRVNLPESDDLTLGLMAVILGIGLLG